ncbi:MAG: hypothetical protein OXG46_10470 [Chloroflexi bacterium]|nr:hypothetical protein [Chloroflexota bacterium]MCY3939369.1 hypothetical protein [Chloroflexota bacterium]
MAQTLEERVESLEENLVTKDDLNGLETRLTAVERAIVVGIELLKAMNDRLDNMDGRLDNVDGRLDKMDSRLERIEELVLDTNKAVKRRPIGFAVEDAT